HCCYENINDIDERFDGAPAQRINREPFTGLLLYCECRNQGMLKPETNRQQGINNKGIACRHESTPYNPVLGMQPANIWKDRNRYEAPTSRSRGSSAIQPGMS